MTITCVCLFASSSSTPPHWLTRTIIKHIILLLELSFLLLQSLKAPPFLLELSLEKGVEGRNWLSTHRQRRQRDPVQRLHTFGHLFEYQEEEEEEEERKGMETKGSQRVSMEIIIIFSFSATPLWGITVYSLMSLLSSTSSCSSSCLWLCHTMALQHFSGARLRWTGIVYDNIIDARLCEVRMLTGKYLPHRIHRRRNRG